MSAAAFALEPLLEAERRLDAELGARASLEPTRARATSLGELGERMLREVEAPELWRAHSSALAALALAQLEHFPQNLFWDLDYPALSLVRAARAHPAGARAYLGRYAELMTALHAAYGQRSPIRFRYVHDFLYGFDWERWVASEPDARSHVGPFELPFLERALERSHELVQAIEAGDASYPPLEPGRYRNPFGFSREPDQERLLHRALLERGAIPVRSFDAEEAPTADRQGSRVREQLAAELGLSLER